MNFFQKSKTWIVAHKIVTAIIVLILGFGSYYIVKAEDKGKTVTTYTLSTVATGTVITTVTGTGQVSADNDEDVTAQVSGTISAIPVSVGQTVTANAVLAHIDSTDAQQSLESAQLSYNKLVEPPTAANLSSAQNSVSQAYSAAFNSIGTVFTDLQTILPGLNGIFYGQNGFFGNQNSFDLSTSGQNYRSTAGLAFDTANDQYETVFAEYENLSRSSATSSIVQVLSDAYAMESDVVESLKDTQAAVNFVVQNEPTYDSKESSMIQSEINSWLSQASGDAASLLSAQNSIESSENSLATLVEGPDTLDQQSGQLSLTEAEQNYDYTNVRAPFAGIVAKIDVTPEEQINNGATIATIVTPEEYATISLNEVDAAKISVGQKATLTFDAVNDLSIAGTVSEVDGIGTVSQGVVTYNVKIAFDTNDSRVKPGMSVDAAIITAAHAGVLVVPAAAVKTQGSISYVEELDQKYPASEAAAGVTSLTAPRNIPITVGLSDNTNTEIVSGLAVGDQVVSKTLTSAGSTAATTKSAATAATTRTGGGFGGGGGSGAVLRGL